jgi:Thiamin pyrophosphokinase, vitamin B1 binding domain
MPAEGIGTTNGHEQRCASTEPPARGDRERRTLSASCCPRCASRRSLRDRRRPRPRSCTNARPPRRRRRRRPRLDLAGVDRRAQHLRRHGPPSPGRQGRHRPRTRAGTCRVDVAAEHHGDRRVRVGRPLRPRCRAAGTAGLTSLVHGPGTIAITGPVGSLLSIVPVGGACHGVRTTGLRFSLHDEPLDPFATRGVSNEVASPDGSIELRSGHALVIAPHALGLPATAHQPSSEGVR